MDEFRHTHFTYVLRGEIGNTRFFSPVLRPQCRTNGDSIQILAGIFFFFGVRVTEIKRTNAIEFIRLAFSGDLLQREYYTILVHERVDFSTVFVPPKSFLFYLHTTYFVYFWFSNWKKKCIQCRIDFVRNTRWINVQRFNHFTLYLHFSMLCQTIWYGTECWEIFKTNTIV